MGLNTSRIVRLRVFHDLLHSFSSTNLRVLRAYRFLRETVCEEEIEDFRRSSASPHLFAPTDRGRAV